MAQDDSLAQQNRANQDNALWVHQFNVLALLLALLGCSGMLLINGWTERYPFSLVAALATSAVAAAVVIRLAGFPDQERLAAARVRPATVLLVFVPGVVADAVLVQLVPDATVGRIAAFLLIVAAAFAGLVIASVEGWLEYLFAGMVGLALSDAIPAGDGRIDGVGGAAVAWVSYFLPAATTLVILPLILRNMPAGLLGAGVLSIVWAMAGEEGWGAGAVSFWSAWAGIAMGALAGLRILCGLLPLSQAGKLRVLLSLALITTGLVLLAR